MSVNALFWNELLALSNGALMSTLTTGNDYFVFVASIRSDTTKTRTIGFTDLFIIPWYLFSYLLFVSIEMREKLHSQHETVISLPKS